MLTYAALRSAGAQKGAALFLTSTSAALRRPEADIPAASQTVAALFLTSTSAAVLDEAAVWATIAVR